MKLFSTLIVLLIVANLLELIPTNEARLINSSHSDENSSEDFLLKRISTNSKSSQEHSSEENEMLQRSRLLSPYQKNSFKKPKRSNLGKKRNL